MRVVEERVNSTAVHALLDTGALPNIMTEHLSQRLNLTPGRTNRHITVAGNGKREVIGELRGVPIKLGDLTVPLNFLVLADTPFEVIIGLPTMEALYSASISIQLFSR